jgi:peroxidase
LRGLIHTPAKERDLTAIDDIRNMLILGPGSTIKLDLLAINTQRGRDHGLPDFNTLN